MFAPKDKPQVIVPVRLDESSPISFQCSKDLSCFTKCCKEAHIILTPCDIIRLKKRLKLSSDEFLFVYTGLGTIENTELPVPVLKMREDEVKSCPFLVKEGCGIYEDRPLTCRYYPIASGVFHNLDESQDEKFFALVKEPHCMGHDLGEEITVGQWLDSQGIKEFEEVNKGWTELILRRKSLGPFVTIQEKTKQMFFTGCYNVDSFRRFVFESKFLDIYIIPEERLQKAKEDDYAMLDLAIDWLRFTFFGDPVMELREQYAEGEMIEAEP